MISRGRSRARAWARLCLVFPTKPTLECIHNKRFTSQKKKNEQIPLFCPQVAETAGLHDNESWDVKRLLFLFRGCRYKYRRSAFLCIQKVTSGSQRLNVPGRAGARAVTILTYVIISLHPSPGVPRIATEWHLAEKVVNQPAARPWRPAGRSFPAVHGTLRSRMDSPHEFILGAHCCFKSNFNRRVYILQRILGNLREYISFRESQILTDEYISFREIPCKAHDYCNEKIAFQIKWPILII
jgi:hypothetical protein